MTALNGSAEQEMAAAVIRLAYEKGINFFDCADAYSGGEAEKFLGRILKNYPRSSIVVSSKVWRRLDRILPESGTFHNDLRFRRRYHGGSHMYFMIDSRSIPQVRLVNETAIEPPYVHRRRIPHEWIIYVIKKGEMELEEDGMAYHLVPGDLLVLSPEGQHEGTKATYCEYFYIHFQHADIRAVEADEQQLHERMYKVRSEALKGSSCGCEQSYPYGDEEGYDLLLPKYCHMTDEAVVSLTRGIYEIMLNNRDHMEYYKTLCGCLLLQLLVDVSRHCLSAELESSGMISARSYQKVLAVQNYLLTAYQEQITGDQLARQFDMNFDYLNRLFRQSVGRPIFQYLSSLRIARAKELLTTTSMRISQISERVGFLDESYFSKVFKKYTGVCPADYAKIAFNDRAPFSSTCGSASGRNS